MPDLPLLPIIMRWLHILSACIALGGPFFVRFALIPAANAVLDDETHQKLRQRVNATWKHIVYLVITLFLVSGAFNFVTIVMPMKWPDPSTKSDYHALFGLKMMLALWVFFLASALSGRSKALAFFRQNAKLWLTVLIVSLLVILMLSNTLRALRDKSAAAIPAVPATAH